MLNPGEMLIVSSSTFTSKKNNGAVYYALDCVYVNSFSQYKVKTFFSNDATLKLFTGPGIYKATFGPESDIIGLSKVKAFELP